ncbi:dephospho-CoA kinase [Chromobacterium haemolyticum]|uniref:dephospho-CoA kinase n=1 Tax=Chromobacterium haemolyticum TaxID=394935 RepID=UPI0023DD321A|nr:dephospho-CoA kinase [Chromobacterium haemolyticum]
MLSRTLLVDCDESVQLERVMRRNGMDEKAVRAIMAAQCSRAQRRERADDIICNNDSLAALSFKSTPNTIIILPA